MSHTLTTTDTSQTLSRHDQLRRLPPRVLQLSAPDSKLAMFHVVYAFVALLLGGIAGLLQAAEHSGHMKSMPFNVSYYELLTAHGILMALVFTTLFILGFFHSGMAVVTDGALRPGVRKTAWAGFWAMVVGGVFVLVPLLMGKASVLYTFYAPMQASPWFYVGLALFVVGSWIGGWALFAQYASWRKAHGATASPLFAFMTVATMLVWQVASLGVAIEVLFQLIPWSFGWVDRVDVLLSRTLFWFFGHPLVYFWLMPAYVAWYLVMPKLIGGRVFSDNFARLSFMLLLIFSIPVGLHHQFQEPGIETKWKLVQMVLTFAVAIPSLMTAFALFATMEAAGRARGYRGLFGWLKGLPWKDARFFALFMGMFTFIPGGAGGLILASYDLNQVAHNTIFVTGHFHLTVATAVALSFIGTAFWLVPHAMGRIITPRANKWMLIQVWLWVIGMYTMSLSQHIVGIMGVPRRTKYVDYGAGEKIAQSWQPYQMGMAIGGTILFMSVLIAVIIVFYLMFRAPRETAELPRAEFPLADPPLTGIATPRWLENWKLWSAVLAVLIIAAYTAPIASILRGSDVGSKGFKPFTGTDKTGITMPASSGQAQPAAKQGGTAKATDSSDADPKGTFASTCGSCHALKDAGTTGAVGPSLDQTKMTQQQIEDQIKNGGGAMPTNLLQGDDAKAVAEYIEKVKAG